jgi:lyso-ornithine lipid O-acyltransferase
MQRLRGMFRLLAFAAIALYYLLRIFLRQAFTPTSQHQVIHAEMGRWAQALVSAMGITYEVSGEVPHEGVLLLPNHRSYIDVVFFPIHLPVVFVAKAEVADWPLIGRCAKALGTVFVKRENRDSRRQTRQEVASRLQVGRSVVVFPEGTTTAAPTLLDLKPGMFVVAAEQGLPVAPVALEYGDPNDAWIGKDSFVPHFLQCFSKPRTHLRLHFGPVFRDDDPERLRGAVCTWLRSQLNQLEEELGLLQGEAVSS